MLLLTENQLQRLLSPIGLGTFQKRVIGPGLTAPRLLYFLLFTLLGESFMNRN